MSFSIIFIDFSNPLYSCDQYRKIHLSPWSDHKKGRSGLQSDTSYHPTFDKDDISSSNKNWVKKEEYAKDGSAEDRREQSNDFDSKVNKYESDDKVSKYDNDNKVSKYDNDNNGDDRRNSKEPAGDKYDRAGYEKKGTSDEQDSHNRVYRSHSLKKDSSNETKYDLTD